jgi:two-component system, chemotaxis family, CheB/CheR fusion protein
MDEMTEKQSETQPSYVVGIGASAGGLEALIELFSELAPDTGMAFLVVMHFDPNHESLSAKLLSDVTSMPVHEAVNGEPLRPNHVYIIPPAAPCVTRREKLS